VEKRVPLAVDLDGTLLRTDMLLESLFVLARRKPLTMLALPLWWMTGRAQLEHRLAVNAHPDLQSLPRRGEIIAFLEAARQRGQPLVLVTAANEQLARDFARALPLFDAVLGSDGSCNLTGEKKRDRLVQVYGAGGFDYLGDDAADLPVWCAARRALLATASRRMAIRIAKATPITVVGIERYRWRDYLRALRPLHWVKNGLVFVPLVAVHLILDGALLTRCAVAFAALCLCASGIYLLNDMLDLPADRAHPQKKSRMLASGRVPLSHALVLMTLLLSSGFALAFALSRGCSLMLGVYCALMVGYSLKWKDIALIDVLILAVGYALRLVLGSVATGVRLSGWLLMFCVFLFFCLALIKRFAELRVLDATVEVGRVRARGYLDADKGILVAQGIASGYLAVLVLALYTNSDIAQRLYARHEFFWGTCLLLMYWISYLWLQATRGLIHDDPVIFALTDRVSRRTILCMAALTMLAL
jgi:4-hydroxybenzoate polyprenyltransferase/phosphoserine phosphatase